MARILVVDDDNKLRQLIRHVLEDAGYEVVEAPNGKVALEVQQATPADLIITDMFMPEMEGTEFIMDMSAEFPDVKIIAMSGRGSVADVDYLNLASNLGALKTFRKPIDQAEILAAVRELLG